MRPGNVLHQEEFIMEPDSSQVLYVCPALQEKAFLDHQWATSKPLDDVS